MRPTDVSGRFDQGDLERLVAEWYDKRTLILGCGNVLFGDDGFGPAVARQCSRDCLIPPDVAVLNAGTSVRKILFDVLLSEEKPATIVIVDAVDRDREPGDLFELDIDSYPTEKTDDFSMHQVPTSNLLRELRDLCGVDVAVLACQVGHIPEEVSPGLSDPVSESVERAVTAISREYLARS
jgi:coenzyme F420 hydrogenase subunit delta